MPPNTLVRTFKLSLMVPKIKKMTNIGSWIKERKNFQLTLGPVSSYV
jgi:hypothetical protein